jgi:hypothetical protein
VNARTTTMCTSDDVALAASGSQSIRGVPQGATLWRPPGRVSLSEEMCNVLC